MPVDDDLTPPQREAVEHGDGPLLILAAPGSGKTRVITRRIVRLIERGVDAREILAITFTNKAASEMVLRVEALYSDRRVSIGTFHRFCARLLRSRAEAVGLQTNFTIFDTADQRQLIRRVLSSLDIDPVHFPPTKIAARISNAKNDLLTADDYVRRFSERVGDHMQAVVAKVFPLYRDLLLESNAVDFDDLLLHVVTLLGENPELRRQLDETYRYVLVDEYQDTNLAQFRIAAALSQDQPNLCATGDPDQSIYGWRGAKIDNILRFESEFQNATVIRLEENFRSTKRILRAAAALISHNVYRKAKSLVTANAEGAPVRLLRFRDSGHEASVIAERIRRAVDAGERQWSDFAMFYRVNALSRELEFALGRQRVPFQVAAGLAFYERAEVKDVLAYLRLIHNPADQAAFLRVVNTPRRGIGRKTQARLTAWAATNHYNFLEAAGRADEQSELSKRSRQALKAFAASIAEVGQNRFESVEGLLQELIERVGYTRKWLDGDSEQDRQRLANVEELLTAARQYDQTFAEEATLEGFLETTSLVSDLDGIEESSGKVTLMTLHAAKGLEFPVVYLVAVEQSLIPHERSLNSDDVRELEEERRLLFVGMTRAEEELYLTETRRRDFRGRSLSTIQSQFLRETEFSLEDHSADSFDEPARVADSSVPADDSDEQPITADPPAATRKRPILTTAADLLNGTNTPAEIPQGFAVGMTVRHPQRGLGTVVGIGGFAKRRTVRVEYAAGGEVGTYVVSKCPLQPVGLPRSQENSSDPPLSADLK